ncbi:L,D-transpeptidase family protein [Polymorphum gilvum]|uniref:Putative peptidoglycan binding domain protein n=1 Tax=Polymorphum gilvum (strain LMG 25793 / CGMCC 1.9160 / SL003B-26A1) TaxID=991905 RepID=F2J5A4_POLGS|nr:L,D-transpeptidase family protein [Polymorphum gilvum]ADZ71163.1 Putative peptidoglycan binding domain protein [Polymorphum gilvum SL003B-26A1]
MRKTTITAFALTAALAAALLVSDLPTARAQNPVPASSASALPADPLAPALASLLQGSSDAVAGHYAATGHAPVWIAGERLGEQGRLAIAAFAAANDHALNPLNYHPLELAARAEAATTPEALAALDVDLSRAYVRYATHLVSGRVQPNAVNKALNIFPHVPDAGDLLEAVAEAPDFGAFLDGLSPNTPNYARLKQALAAYRAKAAAGGFTPVPDGAVLKPGMSDPRLDVLRRRMEQQDYLAPGAHAGDVYDGALVEAVKTFQDYHGLAVDGVVGKDTLAEMNVPIGRRLIQMELNMERRRWMPDDLGEAYVFVNLADQNLKVVRDGKTVHTARVVVGKPYHATPVFSKDMTYVEVNPYWNVPPSIATNEYLPKLISNPRALDGQNIRVFSGDAEVSPHQIAWASYSGGPFPFKLRQDPGDGNALGRIKFMFPNEFNIYIHDTPSRALFERAQRSFSHGCIRVSDPFALAEVLLADQGLDRAALDRAKASGDRQVITLRRPIPVHLTYLTAWMNKDGSTHFRKDIYGRDEVLQKALARAMTDNL